MEFFTQEEFKTRYSEYSTITLEDWQIQAASDMIYSQIGLCYRGTEWTSITVPTVIKNASMEQMRFLLVHDIPYVDIDKSISAGPMSAELSSDYSTLALRMLANAGYLYRGVPLMQNMGLNLPFGGN